MKTRFFKNINFGLPKVWRALEGYFMKRETQLVVVFSSGSPASCFSWILSTRGVQAVFQFFIIAESCLSQKAALSYSSTAQPYSPFAEFSIEWDSSLTSLIHSWQEASHIVKGVLSIEVFHTQNLRKIFQFLSVILYHGVRSCPWFSPCWCRVLTYQIFWHCISSIVSRVHHPQGMGYLPCSRRLKPCQAADPGRAGLRAQSQVSLWISEQRSWAGEFVSPTLLLNCMCRLSGGKTKGNENPANWTCYWVSWLQPCHQRGLKSTYQGSSLKYKESNIVCVGGDP